MKTLMPPLGELEQAIEEELNALEEERALSVTIDEPISIPGEQIETFADSFAAGLPQNAFSDDQIEVTCRALVRGFLDRFGSELLNDQGFKGFQRSLIPGLKLVINHLVEQTIPDEVSGHEERSSHND